LFKFIAEKEEVVDTNPMDKITPKEYPSVFGKKGDTKKVKELRSTDGVVYLTPDEVERLAEHVPSRLPVRNELIIKLMFQTGMRPEEVRNLKFQHLDRETRRIQVWSNKTGDVREVTYTSSLDTLLYQWIDGGYRDRLSSAADSEYLFVSLKSDQMGQGNVNHVVKHAAENAGLQETMYNDAAGRSRAKITAHVLRHSFAVESLKNGMPLKMLSDVMGHASTDTTEIYLEVTREDTVEAMEKYGPGRM
jgi:integrase/recombinase XerD